MPDIFDQITSAKSESPEKGDIFDQITSKGRYRFAEEPTAEGEEEPLVRHTARTGARIGETLLGLPGDISTIPERLISFAAEKFTGKPQEGLRKTLEMGRKAVTAGAPTSSELKDLSKQISGGYTEPQSKAEAFADDIVSDAVALMIPIKGKIPFMRALTSSTAANLAEEGIKQLGGEDKAATGAKLGTLFLSSLLGRGGIKGAEKFASNLYKEAEAAIPEGASVSAEKMAKNLGNLKTKLSKGTLAPSEKAVIDEIDAVLEKVKDGKIGADELIASKRSMNEKMGKFLYETPEKAAQARAKKLFPQVKSELNETLKEYGKKNPEFYEPYRQAEESFATISQSKRVSNFIKKHTKPFAPHTAMGTAIALFTQPAALLKTGGALAAGYPLLKSSELAYRVAKSPTLRRHYMNVANAALREDAVAMNKNLKKLSEELEKEKD